ncbi:hypothetical protein [Spongorhabdus nitratireducens]
MKSFNFNKRILASVCAAQVMAVSPLALASFSANGVAGWFKDSSVELSLSSISNKETAIEKSDSNPHKREDSFDVLITEVNFSTGYINDFAKLDLSGLRVVQLSSEKPDSIYFVNGKNYGQADGALTIKPLPQLELTTGRVKSSHVLLGTGDYRTTPRRYQLNRLSFQQGMFSFSAMEVTRAMRINGDSDYKAFKVNGKREPVRIVDAALDFGNTALYATYGKQTDKEAYSFAEISYSPELTETMGLDLGINYRSKQRIGKARVSGADNNIHRWAGKIQLNFSNSLGMSHVMLAYAETEENKDMPDTVGFEWNLNDGIFRGCKNGGYYVTGHKGTFNHEGGRATKVEIGHSFNGVLEGLYTAVYFAKESNVYPDGQWKHGHDQRQYEKGVTLRYSPMVVPGLEARFIYGKNKFMQAGKYGMDQHTARSELTLSYSIPLEL